VLFIVDCFVIFYYYEVLLVFVRTFNEVGVVSTMRYVCIRIYVCMNMHGYIRHHAHTNRQHITHTITNANVSAVEIIHNCCKTTHSHTLTHTHTHTHFVVRWLPKKLFYYYIYTIKCTCTYKYKKIRYEQIKHTHVLAYTNTRAQLQAAQTNLLLCFMHLHIQHIEHTYIHTYIHTTRTCTGCQDQPALVLHADTVRNARVSLLPVQRALLTIHRRICTGESVFVCLVSLSLSVW
jgi:hypothetical protein